MHVNLLLDEGERGKLQLLRVIEGLDVNVRMYAKMFLNFTCQRG